MSTLDPRAIEDMAALLWRTEAEDVGAPASVAQGRTREAFDEQSDVVKDNWRKFARAALSQPQAGEPVWSGYGEFTPIQVGCSTGSSQPANPAQVTDAIRVADALEACDWSGPSIGNKAILQKAVELLRTAAIGAGGQAVAGIVPEGCTGKELVFDPGALHVNKDGSGYFVVDEGEWTLEDDRCEGPDGPEGSVHWITRLAASEMQALRDFLNGSALSQPHPADERVVEALAAEERRSAELLKRLDKAREGTEPDYCYDPDEWEFTSSWDERDQVHGHGENLPLGGVMQVATLIRGPRKWVANVPVTWDENGDPDDSEIQWFDTEEEANSALSAKEVRDHG